MSHYKMSEQEQKRAEKICRQYISPEENKMKQLEKLNHKVKLPGKIAGGILGVTGSLVMGTGMAKIMVYNEIKKGLIYSIPGMAVALLSYPVYRLITEKRKGQYADQIIELSNELTAEQ